MMTVYISVICRIFDSLEGKNANEMKDDLKVLIEQREIDVLTKWSILATDRIHASTTKYLLKRTESGLISTNFDDNVSMC